MVRLFGFKRTLSITVAGVLAAASLLPAQAFAASTSGCNPITSGLWSGVSFVSGTQFDCHGNPVMGSSTDQNTVASTTMTGQYVALGDSVAAGLGLPLDSSDPNNPACGVSSRAYGAFVAASLQMPYQNFACSGATAGDLVTDQRVSGSGTEIQPQLDAAFANGTPSLISITAGANDVYWSTFLQQCYDSTCGGASDQVAASSLRNILSAKLAYVFSNINSRSGGSPPPVIITGYYQPLSSACAQSQTNLTANEINWIRSQTDALNQTISDAASNYTFVHFAPVDFSGHELCSNDPWVQGPNAAAPFHPTAAGQQAISNAILTSMR